MDGLMEGVEMDHGCMGARARALVFCLAFAGSLGMGCNGDEASPGDAGPPLVDGAASDDGMAIPDDGIVIPDEGIVIPDEDMGIADGGMGERVTVQNHDLEACSNETVIQAVLPDEAGHWSAERLVPPSTPFRVDEIEYWLRGAIPAAMNCTVALPHRVFVLSAPDGLPPAAPSEVASYRVFDVPAFAGEFAASRIALDPPLEVGAGEAIFVGVEVGVGEDAPGLQLCINVCPRTRTPAVSFWSNAGVEPYSWADLVVEFDLPNNAIRAYGVPAR